MTTIAAEGDAARKLCMALRAGVRDDEHISALHCVDGVKCTGVQAATAFQRRLFELPDEVLVERCDAQVWGGDGLATQLREKRDSHVLTTLLAFSFADCSLRDLLCQCVLADVFRNKQFHVGLDTSP